jgi:hypothetical protein
MTDAVEVAIELALLDRVQDFATAQGLTIALPNIEFTPPAISKAAKYLRATLVPADTATIGVANTATNQHLGLLQIDVFFGSGAGEIAARRIAASIISYFIRGTRIVKDGFNVDVLQTPRLGPSLKDGVWNFIPVRIPYNCFAIPA